LLVDTLFDQVLTRQMLDAMEPVTATRPIDTVVNTHANGDHCYGNGLLEGAEIVTTEAAAREMGAVPPSALVALLHADLDPVLPNTSKKPSEASSSKGSPSQNRHGRSPVGSNSNSVTAPFTWSRWARRTRRAI